MNEVNKIMFESKDFRDLDEMKMKVNETINTLLSTHHILMIYKL